MNTLCMDMMDRMRTALGLRLLQLVMWVLPAECYARIGARRGLEEQRQFEKYEGYTRLLGGDSLPFDRWREQWRWLTREVHRSLPAWKQTDAQLDQCLSQVTRFRHRGGRVVPMRKAVGR